MMNYTKIIKDLALNNYFIVGEDNGIIKSNFPKIDTPIYIKKIPEMAFDSFSYAFEEKNNQTIDDFIISFRVKNSQYDGIENTDIMDNISKYPFIKQEFSSIEFYENLGIIINDYFDIDIDTILNKNWIFKKGYYFFNRPSMKVIGVEFEEMFWGIWWEPYI